MGRPGLDTGFCSWRAFELARERPRPLTATHRAAKRATASSRHSRPLPITPLTSDKPSTMRSGSRRIRSHQFRRTESASSPRAPRALHGLRGPKTLVVADRNGGIVINRRSDGMDPVLSQCDVDALAFVFAWRSRNGATAPGPRGDRVRRSVGRSLKSRYRFSADSARTRRASVKIWGSGFSSMARARAARPRVASPIFK